MTHRERMLAILNGRSPDRIPWIPRLNIWYDAHRLAGTLPEEYREKTLQEVERDVFGTVTARDGVLWRSELCGVEVQRHEVGQMETVTEYVTPVGTVTTKHRGTGRLRSQGFADVQIEFMLKRREDYPVVRYLVEHTQYTPTFEEYERYDHAIADQSYPMVKAGDRPFHYWMLELAGYNQAFYHLNDFPDKVELLLDVLTDRNKQTIWKYMLDSSARLFQHGIHLSSHMTPPPLFEQYITPYFQELTTSLRARGKTVAMHADNDTRAILSQIKKAGFGMVESFVTSPMVPTTLAEARAACAQTRSAVVTGKPLSCLRCALQGHDG